VKEFDEPRICLKQDEFDQLQECRRIVQHLWQTFGPVAGLSATLARRIMKRSPGVMKHNE